MPSKHERFLPYTGVLAGLLFAVTMLSTYSDQYGDPQAAAVINNNVGQNTVAYIAMGLCCVSLLFFAGTVRVALGSGRRGSSTYAAVAFGAAVVIATSKAIDALLLKAGLDAAGREDLAALHTLAYLGSASWLPWVAASAAFYLAVGLGGLATATLPRWLAIVTLVLGVSCLLGPAGIAVYLATPLWFAVTGIVLARRSRLSANGRVPEPV
jgi:hypothetical protein